MNSLRKLHLDLRACELEDRLLPVVANLGMIVLSTGGHVLLIPRSRTPAARLAAPPSPRQSPSRASAGYSILSRATAPASPVWPPRERPDRAGVREWRSPSARPPAIATASIPLVTRNTIANDALNPPPRIGRLSADQSPVLPVGEFYRGGFPENAPARPLPAPPLPLPPGVDTRSTD